MPPSGAKFPTYWKMHRRASHVIFIHGRGFSTFNRECRASQRVAGPLGREVDPWGDLAPSLPGCVVAKWRDMGSFWASREWDGVHLYGSVFTGISTGMGRIFSFVPLSCKLHNLKTKGIARAYTSILSNVVKKYTSD